jgi:hypothetical protein
MRAKVLFLMLIHPRRQLKTSNCIAVGAINGAEAVDLTIKAGDGTFDCILMDCEMVSNSQLRLQVTLLTPI